MFKFPGQFQHCLIVSHFLGLPTIYFFSNENFLSQLIFYFQCFFITYSFNAWKFESEWLNIEKIDFISNLKRNKMNCELLLTYDTPASWGERKDRQMEGRTEVKQYTPLRWSGV